MCDPCVDVGVYIGLYHTGIWLTDEIMAPINGLWLFACFVVKDNSKHIARYIDVTGNVFVE